ncbi:MAG TPA: cold shock domain-containing protein, partial [Pirellulales bacterium]|nr:cold shock domain-containing protein [Pirellulales bacterium]
PAPLSPGLDSLGAVLDQHRFDAELTQQGLDDQLVDLVVLGDEDFKPVMQHIRTMGKRVAIASIKDSCAPELSDPRDPARVKDFDVIWLDDLLEKLELRFEKHQLPCEGPLHKGNRLVWTTFHPRKGQRFYCDQCREEFNRERLEAQSQPAESQSAPNEGPTTETAGVGMTIAGVVKRRFADQRQYGFIHAADGDYFFHLTDVVPGTDFEKVNEGMEVEFEVAKRPAPGRNGNAQNVRRRIP